ncbi:endocytosis defective- protein [Dimargaris cristalligena]|uniref:Cytoskeletal-regulatory complex EF hand-domain-containing protein n=1 Tax=Dimargaris cristalligena TaxID=215637 RepID=A0A4P9ZS61_9FUNG|nr:endocytosis defective- protein [Dimargaris cristalligena]RKP36028.1 cytoskeletal-regulatory complex EF hand-domain-containing protein [Dimargaris cristalligena]|eukprot:RKP36028.1 cytoskeletal-regulatory complex EF hand-domain-containing protein [Dimargaris cristalligena]
MQLSPAEYSQYQTIFQNAGPVNGVLSGERARNILVQSNLPHNQLASVWNLADIDKDGALDLDEFCVAMKLVYAILGGQVSQLPPQLPPALVPASKAHLLGGGGHHHHPNTLTQTPTPAVPSAEPFTWYIPPPDRVAYEARFNLLRKGEDSVSLLFLNDFLRSLGLPWDQITQCWSLVDIKKMQVLNKEQFILLMHLLTRMAQGVRIPASLPASVQDIIHNSLKLSSSLRFTATQSGSGTGGGSSPSQARDSPGLFGKNSKNVALADSYISKLTSGYTAKSTYESNKSSFPSSAAAILDEEQKLREELKTLEAEVAAAEREADKAESQQAQATPSATLQELEQLLEYQERRKADIVTTPYQLRDQVRQREGELQRHQQVLRDIRDAVAALNEDKAFVTNYLAEGREKLRDLESRVK